MRAGVAIAAHYGHARLRETLLGTNHVDDSLPGVIQAEEFYSEFFAVGLELF